MANTLDDNTLRTISDYVRLYGVRGAAQYMAALPQCAHMDADERMRIARRMDSNNTGADELDAREAKHEDDEFAAHAKRDGYASAVDALAERAKRSNARARARNGRSAFVVLTRQDVDAAISRGAPVYGVIGGRWYQLGADDLDDYCGDEPITGFYTDDMHAGALALCLAYEDDGMTDEQRANPHPSMYERA